MEYVRETPLYLTCTHWGAPHSGGSGVENLDIIFVHALTLNQQYGDRYLRIAAAFGGSDESQGPAHQKKSQTS